jgi:hypothetical protein
LASTAYYRGSFTLLSSGVFCAVGADMKMECFYPNDKLHPYLLGIAKKPVIIKV